jgi:uncharacterized ferritin-like protein (DUF455 family)
MLNYVHDDIHVETAHSIRSRIAVINLLHEARGLDTYPLTLQRFQNNKDEMSIKILNKNVVEEIHHVANGVKWFKFICQRDGVDPIKTFEIEAMPHGRIKKPVNESARTSAGMTKEWYENLLEP